MLERWFICSNQIVTGPFSTQEVQDKQLSGQLEADTHIWWKGQSEWMPLAVWQARLPEILDRAASRSDAKWYYELGADPIGPLTEADLIKKLGAMQSLGQVRIWRNGMSSWGRVFEVQDIMEKLGISRRKTKRAPLLGVVSAYRLSDPSQVFELSPVSISQEGIGIKGNHDFLTGDQISLQLRCTGLPAHLQLFGTIVYVQANKKAGIRLDATTAEAQFYIIEYVNRFESDNEKAA